MHNIIIVIARSFFPLQCSIYSKFPGPSRAGALPNIQSAHLIPLVPVSVYKYCPECNRIALVRANFSKISWGGMPPDPPSWGVLQHTFIGPLWGPTYIKLSIDTPLVVSISRGPTYMNSR